MMTTMKNSNMALQSVEARGCNNFAQC